MLVVLVVYWTDRYISRKWDIASYGLNRPTGQFSENKAKCIFKSCLEFDKKTVLLPLLHMCIYALLRPEKLCLYETTQPLWCADCNTIKKIPHTGVARGEEIHTLGRTSRLLDQIDPVGRFGENY